MPSILGCTCVYSRGSSIAIDMDELADFLRGCGRMDGRKYQHCFLSRAITAKYEEDVKGRLNTTLRRVRERSDLKTPDFVSEDGRLVIEVTSINPPLNPERGLKIDRRHLVGKINYAIEHALDKDIDAIMDEYDMDREDCHYILVVYINLLLCVFYRFFNTLEGLVERSNFSMSDLDGIVFVAQPALLNGLRSESLFPPTAYYSEMLDRELISRISTGMRWTMV
jgi:hypothetical protein